MRYKHNDPMDRLAVKLTQEEKDANAARCARLDRAPKAKESAADMLRARLRAKTRRKLESLLDSMTPEEHQLELARRDQRAKRNATVLYNFVKKIIKDPEETVKFLSETQDSSDHDFAMELLAWESAQHVGRRHEVTADALQKPPAADAGARGAPEGQNQAHYTALYRSIVAALKYRDVHNQMINPTHDEQNEEEDALEYDEAAALKRVAPKKKKTSLRSLESFELLKSVRFRAIMGDVQAAKYEDVYQVIQDKMNGRVGAVYYDEYKEYLLDRAINEPSAEHILQRKLK